MIRCDWCLGNPLYERYHDEEWGVPVYDDTILFEYLTLEGAQAGLNWLTILKRRDAYRLAFDGYDLKKIVNYNQEKIDSLLENKGIIRNKLKIHSVIKNAKVVMAIQEEFGSFSHYLWSFVDHTPIQNECRTLADVPSETDLSRLISKDLKKRGCSFVGPTIMYAYMQSIGMVNDHLIACHRYEDLSQ